MPRVKRNIQDGYNTAFAKRLRMLIEEKNITQNQLAGIVGKTRQAVNNYTLGNTAPDSDTLIKLSEYFNVSVDYLLGLSDVKTVDKNIKKICDYTGLCQELVEKLHNKFTGKDVIDEEKILINKMMLDDSMNDILIDMLFYRMRIEEYVGTFNRIMAFNIDTNDNDEKQEFFNLCEEVCDFKEFQDFKYFKISREFIKLTNKINKDILNEAEELYRRFEKKYNLFIKKEGANNGND